MSVVEIYEGTGGYRGLTDKMLELGIIHSVLDETNEAGEGFRSCYLDETKKIGLKGTLGKETDTEAFYRWIDMMNFEASYLKPIHNTTASYGDSSAKQINWKIIKIGNTCIFGVAQKAGTAQPTFMRHIIAEVIDENNNVKKGMMSFTNNGAGLVYMVTDKVVKDDYYNITRVVSDYSTLLFQMHCTTNTDKFINLYSILSSPYSTVRKMTLNGRYFYVGDERFDIAIEVDNFE